MKNYLSIALSLLLLLMVMQSCQKEVLQSSGTTRRITIDTTLAAGSDYYLNLDRYGNDDAIADIIQQPVHYSVSELEELSDVFSTVYHYAPDAKSTTPDQVVLAISTDPDEKKCTNDSTIITIHFSFK